MQRHLHVGVLALGLLVLAATACSSPEDELQARLDAQATEIARLRADLAAARPTPTPEPRTRPSPSAEASPTPASPPMPPTLEAVGPSRTNPAPLRTPVVTDDHVEITVLEVERIRGQASDTLNLAIRLRCLRDPPAVCEVKGNFRVVDGPDLYYDLPLRPSRRQLVGGTATELLLGIGLHGEARQEHLALMLIYTGYPSAFFALEGD